MYSVPFQSCRCYSWKVFWISWRTTKKNLQHTLYSCTFPPFHIWEIRCKIGQSLEDRACPKWLLVVNLCHVISPLTFPQTALGRRMRGGESGNKQQRSLLGLCRFIERLETRWWSSAATMLIPLNQVNCKYSQTLLLALSRAFNCLSQSATVLNNG